MAKFILCKNCKYYNKKENYCTALKQDQTGMEKHKCQYGATQ